MNPRVTLCGVGLLLTFCGILFAQDIAFEPDHQQIPALDCLSLKGVWETSSRLCTRKGHHAWLADIEHWWSERQIRIGYDGWRYDLPMLRGTQSSFLQGR